MRSLSLACLLMISFAAQAQHWGSETITVWDNDIYLNDVGLAYYAGYYAGPDDHLGYEGDGDFYTTCIWAYFGDYICGHLQLVGGSVYKAQNNPWLRVRGWDHTNFPCNEPDETDLGNGWCRRTIDVAGVPFSHLPDLAGACEDYSCDRDPIPNGREGMVTESGFNAFEVDNLVVEVISNNVVIDFDPWEEANEMRPTNAYTFGLMIKTTSIDDGDAYDFDASTVDADSLRLGPGQAINVALVILEVDYDDDDDTDYIFGFKMEDTGYDCLTDSITLSGKTMSGDPIAGMDAVTAINCEQQIDIDVDPFNDPNVIRPNDNYNMTVAILGLRESAGDETYLYPGGALYNFYSLSAETLRFGPAETTVTSTPVIADVDGDGFDDMLVNFNVFDAGIACGDTELRMTGERHNGVGDPHSGYPVIAYDTIETTDCSTGACHP